MHRDEAPASTLRLFVGLWPGDELREALVRCQAAWQWPPGAARVAPQRLHLTLHFLGEVAAERAGPLSQALDGVAVRPFTLGWQPAEVWHGGIAVLRTAPSEGLAALHGAVGQVLVAQGFALEPRAFKPHVTLARKAAGARPPGDWPLPRWTVQDFVLVASRGGYHVLSRHR